MKRLRAASLVCAAALAACAGPDCRNVRHVPFDVIERQIEAHDVVLIASRELLSGTALRRRPGFGGASLVRPDECYWYVEVVPSQRAAVKTRGNFLFEADTGKLAGASTTIVNFDPIFTPSPPP